MSNILTRLLMNTSDYDAKLKRAKGSTNDFASNIGGKAAAAVGKFAAGIGVAMGAAEAFDKVIKSSQTTGDKYAEVMAGMKAGVDAFFTSISTGDFSPFITGLDGVINKARQAYLAMDQLGNAQMSFDIAQALAQKDIQAGQLSAKNKFAPIEVSKDGFDQWKKGIDGMIARTKQLTDDTQNYIRTAVEAEAGVKGFNANMDTIMMGLLLDIQDKAKRTELKDLYAKEYQEYKDAMSEAGKLLRTGSKTEAQRMHDTRKYNEAVKELGEKYNKAITVNALLVKYSDEELQAIGSNVKSLIGLDSSIDGLKREFNETAFEFNTRNKAVKGFVPVDSYDGYTVYSAPTATSTSGKGASAAGSTTQKSVLPVIIPQIHYDTPIGKKMLEAMNGKKFEPIEIPIVIDEQIDEEDLSGKWTERTKKIEDMNSALGSTADIFGSLGSIAGSAGDDFLAATFNSMGSIAQMILQLQALCTAQGVSSASKLPFPANLAAIATVVATVASVFASLPKFAEGGVVGGSSYFGDKLLARVNSGETILTQAQSARALSMMGGGNVRVSGDVRLNGKDIYISLRNYMSASGNKL